MIIRITVHDNDFTYILESFAEGIYFQETYPRTVEYGSRLFDDFQTFVKLWNEIVNGSGKLNSEQENTFLDLVKRKFDRYITCRFDGDEEALNKQNYLRKNIDIRLQKSITPRWENGEVVYVFVNAGGKSITL